MNDIDIEKLQGIANQLRIHSIEETTAAGSGHPTSCCSAADVVAALFFGHMRYNAKDPHYYNNDRFVLSKGHAAPLLYAAWAETGLFPTSDLLKLRTLGSDLEGQIRSAFALALGRPPSPEEAREWLDYATKHGLTNFARMLLNSNEFLFVN